MSLSPPADIRVQTLLAAWAPTARSIAWGTPLGAAALVMAIIIQQRVAHPSADAETFIQRLQLIAAIAAASAATSLDDPAETLVETSPTAAPWRAGLRLSHALLTWAVIWVLALALVSTAPGRLPIAGTTTQALALLSVAIGAAALGGSTVGAAAVGIVSICAVLMPERWSVVSASLAGRGRLCGLAAVGILMFVWAQRDTARRGGALPLSRARAGSRDRSRRTRGGHMGRCHPDV